MSAWEARYTPEQMAALTRLIRIARTDTGQARRVANFLLAWWNAGDNGGFDLTDLWNVDRAIADDMTVVFGLIASCHSYPDSFGFEAELRQLVTDWRRPKRDRSKRVTSVDPTWGNR